MQPMPMLMPDAAWVLTLALRSALAAAVGAYPVLTGVTVSTKGTVGAAPANEVRLRRSGGVTASNGVEDSPRVDFMVWRDTDADRWDTAAVVRKLVNGLPNTAVSGNGLPFPVRIGKVTEFIGPGSFPDPFDGSKEIVMFTVETRMRGVAA